MQIALQGFGIKQHKIFFERLRLRQDSSIGSDHDAGAVEDQAVVASHLIAHDDRYSEISGNSLQHLFAGFTLVNRERRSGDVQH